MCIYTHVYMHIHLNIFIYTYMQMYIYIYIYIYIRLLTTGGDSLGLYQTTHDWWRYLRALPDYSRLVAIP